MVRGEVFGSAGKLELDLREGNSRSNASVEVQRSFPQKDVEQRVVDTNLPVIFDEPKFPEAVHEKTHS
jgi:hypothetical protein